MRRVIGIGETVLDIIFKGEKPLQAVPGGSAFNAIISLGRAGLPAAFISETGNDRVGLWVKRFLRENGVDDKGVCVFPDSKSPISLAFLDESNNADYLFYKDHPHDQLDFVYPEVNESDVVVFGSFFAINPVVRPQVAGFLEYAHKHGAILYYDLNYRASHKSDLLRVTPNIIENLELADIVRGSNEDFEVMYRKNNADAVYRSEISFYTKKFIYHHRCRRQLQCGHRLRSVQERHHARGHRPRTDRTAVGRADRLRHAFFGQCVPKSEQLHQRGLRTANEGFDE